jgi:hypothetical protein
MTDFEVTSHGVDIATGSHPGIKEAVYLRFVAPWRKRPVVIAMRADRYTHSEGLSEWRITPHESYGDDKLTDLARSRVAGQLRHEVEAWLTSPAYTESERVAYRWAIKGMVRELRPYDNPTRTIRATIALYLDKLAENDFHNLLTMCDAYDAFTTAYNKGES